MANLFTSDHQQEKSENLSKEIKCAITELKEAFPEQNIEALNWNNSSIAISLDVSVNIPSRGTINGIDIHEREPIFLLLDRQNYPHSVPSVYYNRKDFPATQLPHLNPTFDGIPASFCLHRGSTDNWFAEHTIVDLVERTSNWLSDASRGHLIREEDGFEPTRINYGFIYSIFDPVVFSNIVEEAWRKSQGKSGFAFLWYKFSKKPSKIASIRVDSYAIQLIQSIGAGSLRKSIEVSNKINCLSKDLNRIDGRLFGILVWPPRKQICNKFFAQLPQNTLELKKWANGLGVQLEDAFQQYSSNDLNISGVIPVSIVIPRPQSLIGKQSHLEPISFIVMTGAGNCTNAELWRESIKVEAISHRDPLTLKLARYISSRQDNFYQNQLLFLGCGAIGSKLIFHLARSGQGKMTLVDHDIMSPHNLVRHALMGNCIAQNKADAIKNILIEMYEDDPDIEIDTMKESALNIFLGTNREILDKYNLIIDSTASPIILNLLQGAILPKTLSCCRCEIADDGRIGLMSIEGNKRNPRLDDLQVAIFDSAITKREISSWLRSNKKKSEDELGSYLSEINIGISCSSDTMKLSDDIVSLHTSYFSIGIKNIEKEMNKRNGQIQISFCTENHNDKHSGDSSFEAALFQFKVLPVDIVQSENDQYWQIRLKNGIKEQLHDEFRRAMPNETGGLLIGRINQKAKIIYVTSFLKAPQDSTSSPCAFKMGIDDIPEEINRINELTGGMLGYVGEWHTHPNGEPELSFVDENTKRLIKKYLDIIHIPTHIMIVTKKGLHPHIFSSR